MNNPFQANIFDSCKKFIRLALWIAVTANAAILSVFSICFTYFFANFFWRYLQRTLFSSEWGIPQENLLYTDGTVLLLDALAQRRQRCDEYEQQSNDWYTMTHGQMYLLTAMPQKSILILLKTVGFKRLKPPIKLPFRVVTLLTLLPYVVNVLFSSAKPAV